MNKFSNINFPLFGYYKSISLDITIDKVYTTYNNQTYIIDDRTILFDSYLDRLLEIDRKKELQRLPFDFTYRNLQELLKFPCKIAIDYKGNLYNFEKREFFPYSERTIHKIYNNYFWFTNISYPFNLDLENLDEIKNYKQYYYGRLTYINYNWYLLGLTDTKTNKKVVLL